MWRRLVAICGGFHEIGALAVVIHDHGIDVAWRRVVLAKVRLPRSKP